MEQHFHLEDLDHLAHQGGHTSLGVPTQGSMTANDVSLNAPTIPKITVTLPSTERMGEHAMSGTPGVVVPEKFGIDYGEEQSAVRINRANDRDAAHPISAQHAGPPQMQEYEVEYVKEQPESKPI